MSNETIENHLNLHDWFKETCQSSKVHDDLNYINDLFNKYLKTLGKNRGKKKEVRKKINLKDSDDKKLTKIDENIDSPNCPYLYAYTIEVLKKSAFLEISSNGSTFVEHCYSIIKKTWEKGYSREKGQNLDKPIFDADNLLNGWIEDLKGVNPEFLRPYVQILECEGLDTGPRFNEAIEKLSERITNIINENKRGKVTIKNLKHADEAGGALLQKIRNLTQEKRNITKVIQILPTVCSLSIELAKQRQFLAIKTFGKIIDYLNKPDLIEDFSITTIKQEYLKVRSHIYEKLSSEYSHSQTKQRQEMLNILSDIIKQTREGHRNTRRKIPIDLGIEIKTITKDKHETFQGLVRNIDDETGHFFQMDFNDAEDCGVLEKLEEKIQLTKIIVPKKPICVRKNEEIHKIDVGIATFTLPKVSKDSSLILKQLSLTTKQLKVYPVRGWKSQNATGGAICCSAVFCAEEPPINDWQQQLVPLRPLDCITQKNSIKNLDNFGNDSEAPFADGSEGIFNGLLEWLKGPLIKKFLSSKGTDSFWTGKPLQPVDEQNIKGQIRGELNEHVKSKESHLSPEEESNTGTGKLDYVISRGNDKVVIEIKRSVSPSYCEKGISDQLPAYMRDKSIEYGIFVIFCFNRQYRPESDEIKKLCSLRDTVCKNNNIQIKIVTVNCDRSSPPSKGKPNDPNDTERYFEY